MPGKGEVGDQAQLTDNCLSGGIAAVSKRDATETTTTTTTTTTTATFTTTTATSGSRYWGATYGGGRAVARRGAPANERTRPAGGPAAQAGASQTVRCCAHQNTNACWRSRQARLPSTVKGGGAADAAGCTLLAAVSARTDSHVTWLVGLGPPHRSLPGTLLCASGACERGGGCEGDAQLERSCTTRIQCSSAMWGATFMPVRAARLSSSSYPLGWSPKIAFGSKKVDHGLLRARRALDSRRPPSSTIAADVFIRAPPAPTFAAHLVHQERVSALALLSPAWALDRAVGP